MKKIVFATLALIAAIACNKIPDPAVSISTSTVNVGYTGTAEKIAVELLANRPWTIKTDGQDWYTVEPLEGEGDATLYISVSAIEEIATRAATLTISAETATASLNIVQGLPDVQDVTTGSFVIEEVFFTGYLLEDGKTTDSSDGDQYIKITNNTQNLLYADGLAFCISSESSQNAGSSYWLVDDDLSADILVRNIYTIPGSGTDVPMLPGHSLLLALSAQDFATENGVGHDLSDADYEFFDGEDVDVDNPDVPNLDCIVRSSKTFTMLHGRGFESYALVKFPEGYTVEKFLEEKAFSGTRSFWMNGEALQEGKPYPAGSYLIPNAWVVDGVNCGIEEGFGTPAFNSTVDAGYTGCGKVDKDPDRFGKSALRKVSGGIFADTNNSTNDFTRDAVPTLSK